MDGTKFTTTCYHCGKPGHQATCRFKSARCNFCSKTGHLEIVCRKKATLVVKQQVKQICKNKLVQAVSGEEISLPNVVVPMKIQGHDHKIELDTATNGNFIVKKCWNNLGRPKLQEPKWRYESASKHMPILGTFIAKTQLPDSKVEFDIPFIVSEVPDLNLLRRDATYRMGISVDKVLHSLALSSESDIAVNAVFDNLKPDKSLQKTVGSYVIIFQTCSKLNCVVSKTLSWKLSSKRMRSQSSRSQGQYLLQFKRT